MREEIIEAMVTLIYSRGALSRAGCCLFAICSRDICWTLSIESPRERRDRHPWCMRECVRSKGAPLRQDNPFIFYIIRYQRRRDHM